MEPVNHIASSRALAYKRQNSRNPGQQAADTFETMFTQACANQDEYDEFYYTDTRSNQYNNNGILIFYTPRPQMDFRR